LQRFRWQLRTKEMDDSLVFNEPGDRTQSAPRAVFARARKKTFPHADYRFLVRAAISVARAVASVHASNCVIGDINHSGILISDRAEATLIDADSFQIIEGSQHYLCRVGVPEYTPPELQGKKLGEVVRTVDHDAFGLAVIIFQLLCMGRHPFSGAYSSGEMLIERAIREYRFVYSKRRSAGMSPPPGSVDFGMFPTDVRESFEAAFSPSTKRPSAEHWVRVLTSLESSLLRCSAHELHFFPNGALHVHGAKWKSITAWCFPSSSD